MNAIDLKNVRKEFGSVVAVDDLSFAIPRGVITGFVGPNGSGKSTTMRILATLERQTSGTAKVLDMDVRLKANVKRVRQAIGFMPDYFGLYLDMTAGEYLDFFAAAYHIPARRRTTLIDEILAIVDLIDRRDSLIGGLSRGMQQKLALGRTLVHDPEILLLDEPASGLDPRARVELLECLRELRSMGKTIFISSHILSELQALCDRIIIIEKGRLVYAGPLEAASADIAPGHAFCELAVDDTGSRTRRVLEGLDGVEAVQARGDRLVVAYGSGLGIADIIEHCVGNGVRMHEARCGEADLERVFLQLTEGT